MAALRVSWLAGRVRAPLPARAEPQSRVAIPAAPRPRLRLCALGPPEPPLPRGPLRPGDATQLCVEGLGAADRSRPRSGMIHTDAHRPAHNHCK